MGSDGIYSGYITTYNSAINWYNIHIEVKNTPDGKILEFNTTVDRCCGSSLPTVPGAPLSKDELITKRLDLGSYIVLVPPTGDIYPPSKIVDLEARIGYPGRLYLEWTSPGSDFDKGTGKMKCFTFGFKLLNSLTHMILYVNKNWVKGLTNISISTVPNDT